MWADAVTGAMNTSRISINLYIFCTGKYKMPCCGVSVLQCLTYYGGVRLADGSDFLHNRSNDRDGRRYRPYMREASPCSDSDSDGFNLMPVPGRRLIAGRADAEFGSRPVWLDSIRSVKRPHGSERRHQSINEGKTPGQQGGWTSPRGCIPKRTLTKPTKAKTIFLQECLGESGLDPGPLGRTIAQPLSRKGLVCGISGRI
jgi:hypothetical protein